MIVNNFNSKLYILQFFRKRLNEEGFAHIKVVVPDAMDWSIADRLIEDPEYLKAIDIIG